MRGNTGFGCKRFSILRQPTAPAGACCLRQLATPCPRAVRTYARPPCAQDSGWRSSLSRAGDGPLCSSSFRLRQPGRLAHLQQGLALSPAPRRRSTSTLQHSQPPQHDSSQPTAGTELGNGLQAAAAAAAATTTNGSATVGNGVAAVPGEPPAAAASFTAPPPDTHQVTAAATAAVAVGAAGVAGAAGGGRVAGEPRAAGAAGAAGAVGSPGGPLDSGDEEGRWHDAMHRALMDSLQPPAKQHPSWWGERYQSLQRRMAEVLESREAHYLVIGMVLLDLAIVLTELVLSSFYPTPELAPHIVHVVEEALSSTSIGILAAFTAELVAKLLVFGLHYFTHSSWHMFDAVIVVVSLTLELSLRGVAQEVASLLIFFRLWRIMRIMHGVAEAMELNHNQELHRLHMRTHQLETELAVSQQKLAEVLQQVQLLHVAAAAKGIDLHFILSTAAAAQGQLAATAKQQLLAAAAATASKGMELESILAAAAAQQHQVAAAAQQQLLAAAAAAAAAGATPASASSATSAGVGAAERALAAVGPPPSAMLVPVQHCEGAGGGGFPWGQQQEQEPQH